MNQLKIYQELIKFIDHQIDYKIKQIKEIDRRIEEREMSRRKRGIRI